jgi:hypothetical protein
MDATTAAIPLAKTVFVLTIANEHWRIVSRQRRIASTRVSRAERRLPLL